MRHVHRKSKGYTDDNTPYYWDGDIYTARELNDIIDANIPKMTVSELINLFLDKGNLDELRNELEDYLLSEFTTAEKIAMVIPAAEVVPDE